MHVVSAIARRIWRLWAVVVVAAVMWAGCSGGTGGGPTHSPTPPEDTVNQFTGPRLLITSSLGEISTYKRDAALDGNVGPAMVLAGDKTDMGSPQGLAINSAGQLLVVCDQVDASRDGLTINVFADATRLNGDQAPIRQLELLDLHKNSVNDVAYDSTRDILYVIYDAGRGGGFFVSSVLVFDGTTDAAFDGVGSADREIFLPETTDAFLALAVTPSDDLYIAIEGAVLVVSNASTQDGEIDSSRSFFSVFAGDARDIAITPDGTFYTLADDVNVASIRRALLPADQLDGSVDTEPTVTVPSSLFAHDLAIVGGTAYFSDSDRKLIILDNVVALEGEQEPTREVSGDKARVGGSLAGQGFLLAAD